LKIVSVKQNGKEWRQWRGLGIGASDIAAIMGESPYMSPFVYWLDKTGIRARPAPNEYQLAAMKRGQELEPVVREMFEKKMGRKFEALSAEHAEHDFIRCSFDGINMEARAIIEIKCPGKEAHAQALKGKVPKYYYPQVQQQLLVAGDIIDQCHYISWDGVSKDYTEVIVKHDPAFQARIIEAASDMWKRIVLKELPNVTQRDILKLIEGVEKDLKNVSSAVEVFKLLSQPTETPEE
jgi:putative phage-type endonuclease